LHVLSTDPIDLLLDADGDLDVSAGLQFSTGAAAVSQGIRIRIQMFRGEWFLDLDAGVPYHQDLLGAKFNDTRARAAFRDAIVSAPGVAALLSLTVAFNRSTRVLDVAWKVRTEFDDTIEDTLALGT
jgi:hypothetical protein